MNHSLLSWHRLFLGGATALLAMLTTAEAVAQTCPVAATCTPGRASNSQAAAFNMGILNVTLGSINNTTPGQADGYRDYSCATPAISTNLVLGQNATLSVRTNPNVTENVRVWIDYNNDGAFTGTNELVLSSNNAIQHTATFAPPASAIQGVPLRMRVSADYALVAVPTPCSTPQYSQVEDYAVTITANVSPPVAAFTTDGTTTCTGCVQFTDASQNLPTSWNPRHCYTTAGTYTVTLAATNTAGTRTSAATDITYNPSVPVAATCSPPTTAYCCNYGVVRFRLNTIDNASANGSAGYQNFTCTHRTTLMLGTTYTFTITTGGTLPHDTRMYLDRDNNGAFSAAELVFEALNRVSPTGSLSLPGTTVLNQPLRLRIVTDAVGNPMGPCTTPVSGQVEDYTVVATPNTAPPTASFSSNHVPGGCVNPVQFTDLSAGAPTSWLWNFGDGTTSTLQNPSHQFLTTGTYTVTLTATNTNGMNSTSRTLSITVPCVSYCPSNGTGNGGGMSQVWLTRVGMNAADADPAQPGMTFTPFSNFSANATGGYGNFTSQTITMRAGQQHTLTATINILNFSHRTTAWIDYNRDGDFTDAGEMIVNFTSPQQLGAETHAVPFRVPTTAAGVSSIVGSTRMRVVGMVNSALAPNPCATNILNAEVEDYTVNILGALLATREAQALPGLAVYPNPTADGRLHLRLDDAKAAGTYTATVENLLGATLLRATLRLTPSTDAGLDVSTLAKGVYLLRLRDAQGQTALRRVVRE